MFLHKAQHLIKIKSSLLEKRDEGETPIRGQDDVSNQTVWSILNFNFEIVKIYTIAVILVNGLWSFLYNVETLITRMYQGVHIHGLRVQNPWDSY